MEVLGTKTKEVPKKDEVKSLVKSFIGYVREAFENVYVEKEYEISVREHESLKEYIRLYQDLYINDFMFGRNNARLIMLDNLVEHYKFQVKPLYRRLNLAHKLKYPTLKEVHNIISKSEVV